MKHFAAGAAYPDPNSRSRRLYERARTVLAGGCSRATIFYQPYPVFAARAFGCRVVDVDGVERLDCINNFSSIILGHGHPAIIEAVSAQLQCLTAAGMPTEAEIELAQLLCRRLPSLEQIRFVNSGTEAVMYAFKAARAFTGRSAIAKVEGCYHGGYDFAEVSQSPSPDVWGSASAPASVPLASGTPQGVLDEVVVLPFNEIDASVSLIRANAKRLAAVIVDPLVSRMGFVRASADYVDALREVTAELGVLLIFDEVYALRLGFRGAQGRWNVLPDLTTLGKIIGGGLPVGAVGGRRDVMSVFDHSRPGVRVPHGGTYNANPMTMAAGLACMSQLDEGKFEHLERLGDRARAGIQRAIEAIDAPFQVNGIGSVFALTPGRGVIRNWRDYQLAAVEHERVHALHAFLLNHGILMTAHGSFTLTTPMAEGDIDDLVNAVEAGMRAVMRSR